MATSSKECNNAPYKRRKQTSLALEALGQLIKDSSTDELETDKFNKNDILSLTLSRLLRRKYWPSHLPNGKKEGKKERKKGLVSGVRLSL